MLLPKPPVPNELSAVRRRRSSAQPSAVKSMPKFHGRSEAGSPAQSLARAGHEDSEARSASGDQAPQRTCPQPTRAILQPLPRLAMQLSSADSVN